MHVSLVRTTDHKYKLPDEAENRHNSTFYGTPSEARIASDVKNDGDDDGTALNVNYAWTPLCSELRTL